MTNTPESSAHARLGQLALSGFTLLVMDGDSGFSVLAQSDHAPANAERLAELEQQGDPSLSWLKENLGSVAIDEIEGSELHNFLPQDANNTLVSDIYNGQRYAILLSHSESELSESDIKEARAAALVLQMETDANSTPEISAKELVYLEQASAGASDDEIAEFLQLSLRAVKERKRKAIDDLGAKNIGHAVGIAKRSGLI